MHQYPIISIELPGKREQAIGDGLLPGSAATAEYLTARRQRQLVNVRIFSADHHHHMVN